MSFGIIDVITLVLGMAGFGLSPNPQAPTADQALQYALADADVAIHLDVTSVVPGNYKVLDKLADQPQIKASPDLQALVRKAVGEVQGARAMAKMTTDIDVTADIADATAFFQLVPHGEPRFVVAIHGKFSVASVDKIAQLAGKPAAKLGSGTIVDSGGHDPSIALTKDKDGVMLVGTPDLVRARLAADWKPPSHEAGSNLGYVAEVIDSKPVFAVVLTMSPAARSQALGQLGQRNFATDLVNRHKAAALSIFRDGVGWLWVDSSKAGLDAMELVSSGVLEMLRAAQIAPRGVAKVALGALDSYAGTDKQIDELIKHKAELQKIMETYSGDGNFKVKVDKNAKAMRLTVRATGKSLSEVLPVGLAIPAIVFGVLSEREAAEEAAPPPPGQPAWANRPPPSNPAVAPPPPPAGKSPAPPAKRP